MEGQKCLKSGGRLAIISFLIFSPSYFSVTKILPFIEHKFESSTIWIFSDTYISFGAAASISCDYDDQSMGLHNEHMHVEFSVQEARV